MYAARHCSSEFDSTTSLISGRELLSFDIVAYFGLAAVAQREWLNPTF